MKKIIAYGDTETTGTLMDYDQILDYATVFTENNEVLESVNREMIIKKSTVPAPRALTVNNINPFTPSWEKNAISEEKAVNHFIEEINKYKKDNSFLYVAYNAPFDVQMFQKTFSRVGKDFDKVVPVVFDLYLLAKKLIDDGKLITKKTDFGYSGKLGDVFEALGFAKAEMNAHNALGDSIILPGLFNKLYMLFCGREITDITIDPSSFKMGEIQSIRFITPLSLKKQRVLQFEDRTILVLHNDVKNKKLYIMDSPQMSVNQDLKHHQVINYAQVFDESSIVSSQMKIALKYKQDNLTKIQELDNELAKKQDTEESIEISDFDKVKMVLEKIRKNMPLTEEEKEYESRAEEYSYSTVNEGWSFDKLGPNYKDVFSLLFSIKNLSIGINPIIGEYEILNENKESLLIGNKTAILNYLVIEKLVENKDEEYKKFNTILTKNKANKNPKNLEEMKSQFNQEKTGVFNGANKLHKEILTSLLAFYKKQYPGFFDDIKIPDFKLNLTGFKRP
jgi:DNA polymerase III epsilon subunit-like protein